MTSNRNLKRRVRERAAKTGESYAAARQQLVPSSIRVAVAQMPLCGDPADVDQLSQAGATARALIREAGSRGADLVHLPEGALVSPHKRVMSSTGPHSIGPAAWEKADWAALARELADIVRLAGELGVWVVLGSIHRSVESARPSCCLYVISRHGRIVGRYDERMLSRTKATLMYVPGQAPLVFTAGGLRFGCALGMETHFAEVFAEYEELGVDCVLFSTHGSPGTREVFAVEAAGHAAANSLWISYAGPTGDGEPPAGVLNTLGTWAARCAGGTAEVAVAQVEADPQSPAREWRRIARGAIRD